MYTLSKYVTLPENPQEWFHPYTQMKIGLDQELLTIVSLLTGDINKLIELEKKQNYSPEFLTLIEQEMLYRGFIVPLQEKDREESWHDDRLPLQMIDTRMFNLPSSFPESLPKQARFAFFGVPHDDNASRPGCRFGPELLRNSSHGFIFRDHHYQSLKTLKEERSLFPLHSAFDMGNIVMSSADNQIRQQRISKLVASLPESVIPVMLGGDHAYTYGAVSGLIHRSERTVVLLQFDAHQDIQVWPAMRCGLPLDELSHCNFVSHLLADHSDIEIIQIGVRHFQSMVKGFQLQPDERLDVFSDREVCMALDQVITAIGRNKDIYISLDVDCLTDISQTGYPSALGVSLAHLLQILRHTCRNNRICGLDVMEFGKSHQFQMHCREAEIINTLLLSIVEWTQVNENDITD